MKQNGSLQSPHSLLFKQYPVEEIYLKRLSEPLRQDGKTRRSHLYQKGDLIMHARVFTPSTAFIVPLILLLTLTLQQRGQPTTSQQPVCEGKDCEFGCCSGGVCGTREQCARQARTAEDDIWNRTYVLVLLIGGLALLVVSLGLSFYLYRRYKRRRLLAEMEEKSRNFDVQSLKQFSSDGSVKSLKGYNKETRSTRGTTPKSSPVDNRFAIDDNVVNFEDAAWIQNIDVAYNIDEEHEQPVLNEEDETRPVGVLSRNSTNNLDREAKELDVYVDKDQINVDGVSFPGEIPIDYKEYVYEEEPPQHQIMARILVINLQYQCIV
eukprot:TRINITY_DN8268_c0_g1_i3.p1 TRINITY_DN8268_c0_g1~~TRINITY_DN8268_c0_g1_i3.p1  ORF type:complete len:322 (+),score=14.11 TRINITY_DN8268_c0_g1_i3:181-1146(+)